MPQSITLFLRRACQLALTVYGIVGFSADASAQLDPLALPSPRPASKGAYQWGVEALRLGVAWGLTKGRAHVSISDVGYDVHSELQSGIDGNYRAHFSHVSPLVSIVDATRNGNFHGMLIAGVLAGRGFDGRGTAGACPWCSLSVHDQNTVGFDESLKLAVSSGAVALNLSLGLTVDGVTIPPSCDLGNIAPTGCSLLRRAAERDVVVVSIAQNNANGGGAPSTDQIPFPANTSTVIAVGGMESDFTFWTHSYESTNPGSNWGKKLRLVAPAKDILMPMKSGKYLYDVKSLRCGDRVDATVSAEPTLPTAYAGYGTCTGTSFAAPLVTGIVGLMRSANPLLTAAEVQSILYDTAQRPVSGPAGSGLTFYLPDAGAAVAGALGSGKNNRVSPLFSLYSTGAQTHLFTSSPQMALAAIAGDLGIASFQSFGQAIESYPKFGGKLCNSAGINCVQHDARAVAGIFTTENSPIAGRTLVPLYRMSCVGGTANCKVGRAFAYATTRAQVEFWEGRGYRVDVVEGYIYPVTNDVPSDSLPLCLGVDSARVDTILYASSSGCAQNQLTNEFGQSSGGNYASALFGFVPKLTTAPLNYTDMWWAGESENGWGASITQHGSTQFVVLFVYDNNRKPIWYAMPGGTWNASFTSYSGNLYLPSSSSYTNYNPAAFQPNASVGSATLTYQSANTATLSYTINGISGSKKISRQVFGADNGVFRMGVADLWWAGETQNGWGLNITQQGDVIFPLWYTYDTNGKNTWFGVPGGNWSGTTFTGDIYSTESAPWLGAPYNPASFTGVKRGVMSLTFIDQSMATMTYTVDGLTQTKNIVRQGF